MTWFLRKFGLFMEDRKAILYLLVAFEALIGYAYATGRAPAKSGIPILLLPPSIVAYMLFQQVGSPKNWWAPFFGTTITIDLKKRVSEDAGAREQYIKDMRAWLKEMRIKPVYEVNALRYTFLRRKHAMMFKLAWG